jgi:hypothetical protein
MTRRATRLLWVLTGICLAVGVLASLVLWLGPPDQPWNSSLRELSTLLDVLALLFWLGIFALYWRRRSRRG